ncbi:TonB-dependent receptor [Brevundimonas vesicularis]|uniref:TonB-dependent receptor n=1 Tax=Brevundimonas vesicularis TaxID=41276 RepID=UPI0027D8FBAD|nr:TonB-dependent receptor [Brevundimonas vesicularis]
MSSVAAPALAQEAATAQPEQAASVDDIIVTAQRRSQALLDVPLAISALNTETLTNKGITNSANLATAVPNLQVSSPYGNTQPNFSLRGISVANEYNANQASPVGVYIDDVYIASRTSQGMGLFDLDRVEVLRGPQGTLFGRNTTGGAINFITMKPDLSGTEGRFEAGYGNFSTVSAQGAFETTLVENELGIRAAVNYVNGDGQIENLAANGQDANSQDTLQGRLSIRWKPNDGPLDINLRAYAGRDRGAQAGIHGLFGPSSGTGFFEINENRVGDNKTDAWGVALTVAAELSPTLTLTSISSVDGGSQDLQQAADGSPLDILDINWKSDFDQLSQELRLNYDTDTIHAVFGGFYGSDEITTDNLFNIGSALGPGVNGGFFQHYNQERKSWAIFAQSDFALSEKLTLTAGVRYTKDDAEYQDGFAYLFAGNVGGPVTPLASTVPCATLAGTCAYDPAARYAIDGESDAVTGRLALAYTFDNGVLGYASYSRGYRSGAFNGGGYTSSIGITYIQPEEVNAYEAGLKGRFIDDRLTLSSALFYYDYSNQQVQDTRAGPVSFLVNAPKSEVYGGELEFGFQATDGFRFNGSFGYLDATYKELTLQGVNLSGNELPFAPKVTAQLGFDWTIARPAGGKLTFSPTVSYFSRQYFSPFNAKNASGTGQVNSELQQDAYAKVNASLSWTLDDLTVRAFVNNAFEEETYSYGLDLRGAGFPFNFLVPSAPRTYGFVISKAF